MTPEIETMRKLPHMGTFKEAQRWICSIKDVFGNQPFELHFDPAGIYYVTHKGHILGKGLSYETAIADAESNWKYQSGELTLEGMTCS